LFTLGSFFVNYRSRKNSWATFFCCLGFALTLPKLGWAKFWAIFFKKKKQSGHTAVDRNL
jgi:hypothetical protein